MAVASGLHAPGFAGHVRCSARTERVRDITACVTPRVRDIASVREITGRCTMSPRMHDPHAPCAIRTAHARSAPRMPDRQGADTIAGPRAGIAHRALASAAFLARTISSAHARSSPRMHDRHGAGVISPRPRPHRGARCRARRPPRAGALVRRRSRRANAGGDRTGASRIRDRSPVRSSRRAEAAAASSGATRRAPRPARARTAARPRPALPYAWPPSCSARVVSL